MNCLITNGRLVSDEYDGEKCLDICIENGEITEIGEGIKREGIKSLDAGGRFVLPGLIDMHCNICDPGYEYIDDLETASLSAVRGGFTTITCEPNTKPVIDNKTVVEYIVSKCQEYALANIYPYGSMSIGCAGKEMAEIGEMYKAGIVGISDGDENIDNANFLRNIFRYSKMFDLPVITHCEDTSLSGQGVMNAGYTSSSLGLEGMPREAEEVIVARNIILAEATKCRLHIAHVSTKGSVQLIREAKSRGTNITCETCPQYFCLTEEAVGKYNTLAKLNPPLRTREDAQALLEGLADGTIDVIASGHSPTTMTEKNKEFGKAEYGISSFETTFPLSFTSLVKSGIIPFQELVRLMSEKPAKILGLSKKGRIHLGYDGDIIIVEGDGSFQIDASTFASKAKFSPFHGTQVKGRVVNTVVGGRLVF